MLNKGRILLSAFCSLVLSYGFAYSTDHTGGEEERDSSATTTSPSGGPSINTYTYTTAVGVRGIGTSGLTIKHFTSSNRAIEGILGLWPDAFSATVLFERYVSAFDEPGLNWYYGVGGHISTFSEWVSDDGYRTYQRVDGEFGVGVDGIFGIEYKIREVPIAVSFDLKPFLEVTTQGHAYLALDPGLGVKFTF